MANHTKKKRMFYTKENKAGKLTLEMHILIY